MFNREGHFIGHSPVQQTYLSLLKTNRPFNIKGKTLTCAGHRFPLAMAQLLRKMPKNISYEGKQIRRHS
ncbi:MAG: hypothetical protein GY861_11345 [bacterium]|nr:hypothetical protein [bacterium]